jgi:hypothetical protein
LTFIFSDRQLRVLELRLTLRAVRAMTKMGILLFWEIAFVSTAFFSFDLFLDIYQNTF